MLKRITLKEIIIFAAFIISNLCIAYLAYRSRDIEIVSSIFDRNIKKCEELYMIITAIEDNLQSDPSNLLLKLELLKQRIPISYEGYNLKNELIACDLMENDNVCENNYEYIMSMLRNFNADYIKNNFSITSSKNEGTILKIKKCANTLTEDALWAICYLWAHGYSDYTELLWWKKDDPSSRILIVALVLCQFTKLTDIGCVPEGIIPFTDYAHRFQEMEAKQRNSEINFVKKNRMELAKELSRIMKYYDTPAAKALSLRYTEIHKKIENNLQ